MRKRPANRLNTTCIKLKDRESGFVCYVHIDREAARNEDGTMTFGRVVGLSLTPKTKTGSGLDSLFSELTRALNREIQVRWLP